MKEFTNKVIEVAENLNWSVSVNNNEIAFSKFSPQNQDFSMEIVADKLEEVVEQIQGRCDNFDCSEEAYLWLDNTGHGTNGAPHSMKDVYEDMEECLKMMEELKDELKTLL